jgi:hypothetical protein
MLGHELMRQEIITSRNYQDGELMKCSRCGEEWTFATGAVEYDRQERSYKKPVSPCCRCELLREVEE